MPSIREVAERSGVSVATVSRVFNGSTKVSETTRQRVLEQAQALEYVPSAAARTLVRRRSQLIGIVLSTGRDHPDLQHPFFQEVLVGLKETVGAFAYDLLLFANEEHSYHRRALHHHVDGLVLMGVDLRDPEVERLVASGLPAVGVDLELAGPRCGSVTSDNALGARLAVRHLHDRGHERIATITGLLEHGSGRARLEGYRDELAALGLDELVEVGDFYAESGYRATERLLRLRRPPTALFAASDLMALGAIQAARESGRDVPRDLAVVGFDDIQIAPLVSPPLTTIRQDKLGLGAAAGEAVVALVESPEAEPPAVTLPVELMVRESS